MEKIIKASELKAGMQIVETEGLFIKVIAASVYPEHTIIKIDNRNFPSLPPYYSFENTKNFCVVDSKLDRREILQHQIYRLARIYTSRKVSVANIEWHNRVGALQVRTIEEKNSL